MHTPRFLDPDRGPIGELSNQRQQAAEIDLDNHDTQLGELRESLGRLEKAVTCLDDRTKWGNRLLVGVLASTTGAALMLLAQRSVG